MVAILGLAFTIVGCGGSAGGTQSAQAQPVTQPVKKNKINPTTNTA